MREVIQLVGKFTGVVSGVGACASWTVAMWTPTPALPLSGMAFAVALLMAMLAIIAVIASVHGHGITLIVLFFASFFPIGFFPAWGTRLGAGDWCPKLGLSDCRPGGMADTTRDRKI